jgi:uncharacterized protein YaaR (DUF327 family)
VLKKKKLNHFSKFKSKNNFVQSLPDSSSEAAAEELAPNCSKICDFSSEIFFSFQIYFRRAAKRVAQTSFHS